MTYRFNFIESLTRKVNGVALTNLHFRWLHRHGFGIQSPWAFEFVRDVLFEPLPYYVFSRLKGTRADQQLFRIALATAPHPLMLVDIGPGGLEYIRAAHAGARIVPYSESTITPDTCLVVDQIDGCNRALWLHVLGLPQTTTTFTGRRRGVAFFDPARQRQNYYV